jgi:hypothetical protein
MPASSWRRIAAVVAPVALISIAAVGGAGSAASPTATEAQRVQSTQLISRSVSGRVPNGPSTHPVISGDKRFARVIAFESEASNLVRNDRDGQKDVFAVIRSHPNNRGSRWSARRTVLVSRTRSGARANGPSFGAAVDGGFGHLGRCVAFLSSASNLVAHDSNGKVDAFLSRGPGGKPKRVSLPGNHQSHVDTTQVAVSGNCSRIAFVAGGKLYVRKGNRTRKLDARGVAADPSFAAGRSNDLVFGARGGVYLSKNGTGRPHLVARRGSNPAFNAMKRRVVTYEITVRGRTQIGYKDLGKRQRIISARHGRHGNGNSSQPVIGNSGFYVAFQSDASNLSTSANGSASDGNDQSDVYLYTNVRNMTLVQSVREKGEPVPGGGANPGMSFYANYIVFDSPAPLGSTGGNRQIFMRWLGGI